ncbi:hypothetical protein BRW84_07435 [Oxalobacter formigenes OXCC13]|nr:hypothetical protein BRW84_07435 [Oxalobacter formigenes OXCC13]
MDSNGRKAFSVLSKNLFQKQSSTTSDDRTKPGTETNRPVPSTGEKNKTGSLFPIVEYFHKAIKQKTGPKPRS